MGIAQKDIDRNINPLDTKGFWYKTFNLEIDFSEWINSKFLN